MSAEIDVNKLPLSVASFEDMQENGFVYVDKTDLVAELAAKWSPIFLSRPRRFGKSTLVSTFHELFANGLGRFKGLKIERDRLWDGKTYQVVHLDFSPIKAKQTDRSFKSTLFNILKVAFMGKEHAFTPGCDPLDAFYETLALYPTRSLVLLIDEYDAPLTAVLHDQKEFQSRLAVLSSFFAMVKMYSSKFRFIFITGITRFSNVSIFSEFNNLIDISFDPSFGNITGYTQEELELYFHDYIENAAEVLSKKYPDADFCYAKVLSELERNYDGYCFDEEHSTHVYNPWSILNFLQKPQRGFQPYWVYTGATSSMLVNYLHLPIEAGKAREQMVNFMNLDYTQTENIPSLSPFIKSINRADFPLTAVLYQAGYLTIKQRDGVDFKIGIPNLEVKQVFADLLLQQLTEIDAKELRTRFKLDVKRALQKRNFKALRTELNKTINLISYESIKVFREATFRDWLRNTLLLLEINTETEVQTASGRSDLCFSYEDTLFVMELKVTANPDKVQEQLTKAKAQLKSRKYTVRPGYAEVIALAAVIVNEPATKKHDSKPVLREIAVLEKVDI